VHGNTNDVMTEIHIAVFLPASAVIIFHVSDLYQPSHVAIPSGQGERRRNLNFM
jgi:hypothetical protein